MILSALSERERAEQFLAAYYALCDTYHVDLIPYHKPLGSGTSGFPIFELCLMTQNRPLPPLALEPDHATQPSPAGED